MKRIQTFYNYPIDIADDINDFIKNSNISDFTIEKTIMNHNSNFVLIVITYH